MPACRSGHVAESHGDVSYWTFRDGQDIVLKRETGKTAWSALQVRSRLAEREIVKMLDLKRSRSMAMRQIRKVDPELGSQREAFESFESEAAEADAKIVEYERHKAEFRAAPEPVVEEFRF